MAPKPVVEEQVPPTNKKALGMEHGADASKVTFTLTHEDHTLGNAVRYLLAKNPQVSFVGYSVPHPSEPKMNVRVQTTGIPATEVFLDALTTLWKVSDHIDKTFADAVAKFAAQHPRAGTPGSA